MDGRLKLRRMPRARASACEQPSGAKPPELLRCAADLPDAQYSAQSSRGSSSTCTDSTCRMCKRAVKPGAESARQKVTLSRAWCALWKLAQQP